MTVLNTWEIINIVINFYIHFITTYKIPLSIGMWTHQTLYCCIMLYFIYLYNIYSVSNVNKCSTRWYFVFYFHVNVTVARALTVIQKCEECIAHEKEINLLTRQRRYAIYNQDDSSQYINGMFTIKLLSVFTQNENY